MGKMHRCTNCGSFTKDGLPFCIKCLKNKWEYSKEFIKPKHNPKYLPWALPKFRSVVTEDFITNKPLFIKTIAYEGIYYQDKEHNNFCCVLRQTIGNVSGSAIPANFPLPTYPLDSLIVVDAINNPHVFAYNYSSINTKIINGILIPVVTFK